MEEQPKKGFKTISKSAEIIKQLKLEGKVEILDKPEHLAAIKKMNESMEKVRRDFLYKDSMSELHARDTRLGPSPNNPPYTPYL
jgi:hypothetical protein